MFIIHLHNTSTWHFPNFSQSAFLIKYIISPYIPECLPCYQAAVDSTNFLIRFVLMLYKYILKCEFYTLHFYRTKDKE